MQIGSPLEVLFTTLVIRLLHNRHIMYVLYRPDSQTPLQIKLNQQIYH
jgi:hypothetical protein